MTNEYIINLCEMVIKQFEQVQLQQNTFQQRVQK